MKMKSGSADADRTERFGGSVLPLLLLKKQKITDYRTPRTRKAHHRTSSAMMIFIIR